ncbi:O-methyltransferase family protein [Euphorbia peplus]|nr:O-methyltransferase family protein [Euphorbia peplus]
MEIVNIENMDELIKGQSQVWNTTFSCAKLMCLKCAVELGISDIINTHGEPMSLPDLLAALPIHPSKTHHVHRLMRILVLSGLFSLDNERYSLTPASRFLLKNTAFDVTPMVSFMVDPTVIQSLACLSTWFKNDDVTPFLTSSGDTIYEHTKKESNKNLSDLLNEFMARDSSFFGSIISIKCKEVFEGINNLVDVGGGVGIFAKTIADSFPYINITVLDQPHVIAHSKSSNNLNFIGGDMFEAVPPADAFLFKWIMIDWPEEDCLKMLKNCKEGLKKNGKEDGKIIIIDIVLGLQINDVHDTETQVWVDIAAMATVAGKGRTEEEWAQLFNDAGFTNYIIHPMLGFRSLIEVFP